MTNPGPIPPKPGPPSAPSGPPNVLNQPKPEPNAEITKLPPSLQHLQERVKLKGEVVKTNTDGSIRIRTEQGDIDVRLDRPPPKGERVDVEIEPGRPPQTARVTPEQPADTRPPPTTETEAPPTRPSQTPVEIEVRPPVEKPPQAPAEEFPVRLEQISLPQVIEAVDEPLKTVLKAAAEKLGMKTEIIVTQTQAEISEAVTKITQPPQTMPVSPVITVAPTENISAQPVTIPAPVIKPGVLISVTPESVVILQPAAADAVPKSPTIPGVPANIIQPEAQIGALVTQVKAPQIPLAALPQVTEKIVARLKTILAAPLSKDATPTVTGIVVGHTPQKLPIIAFPLPGAPPSLQTASFFILHTPAPELMPGTEISLTPQPLQPGTALAGFATMPMPFFTPGPWPVMDDVYSTLAAAMPQAAQAFTNINPAPANPAQMGPAALFFIAAVRGGDLTQWLGERATDLIRKAGKSDLFSRLNAETGALRTSDQVTSEWRGVNLPMYHDNQMHKLALYYRHEGEDSGRYEKNGGQVRFIFDLNLDNMGKVQLDGLFRPKRLDLIVRTQTPLSQPMQMHMRQSYIAALEQTQVSGELSFQNKPEQWVTISAERKSFGTSA